MPVLLFEILLDEKGIVRVVRGITKNQSHLAGPKKVLKTLVEVETVTGGGKVKDGWGSMK